MDMSEIILIECTNICMCPRFPEYLIKISRGIPNGFRLFDRLGVWSYLGLVAQILIGNQLKTIS